ncbi:unnamed protein product [Closterium sp. NIES-53]
MTTLRVLLRVAAQRDYELHSLDFSTTFLQESLHEEIWLHCPIGFTGSFPAGTQWSLRRPVYGLRHAPRGWHDTLRTTLAALGFALSTADPSLFLHTNTSLPLFYVLMYVDHLVFATTDTEALTVLNTLGMGLVLGGRGPVVLTGHEDTSWVDDLATQWSSSCEAEIYARSMAAQELRWLTCLLTDLGELPRSPPVQYVDNKAMIALCHEHRLEHRTKHIALRYFLVGELQQRGLLRLAYMATRANTTDVFTKTLPPGDHQRFSTVLGLLALVFLIGLVTTCSPPLCLWRVSTCTQLFASSFILVHYSDIEAAALGATESALPSTAPAEAWHTFTLDSGASRCFFRDSTTLTPLPAPVPVRLADPSGCPVLARSSTVLPCPAYRCPPGCDGHYHHSWGSACVDLHVYTDGPSPGHVHSSAWVESVHTGYRASSGSYVCPGVRVRSSSTPLLCRLLSHRTLLWHHRLGQPSLPRLCGMHSRLLVSCVPRSLPLLPPSPAPPCLPCVEGRQRAAPHSSSFPPMTALLQNLHMDVWGPARISRQDRERYVLLVVDDYTRYTTVFLFRIKGEVPDVLIPWIRAVRLQLRERFREDLLVLCLHSDRGGEFSFNLLREFCRGEGILLSFTLLASPQQNRVAECRIGLVMEVGRTSMIHAAAPHLLWPFAVRYAAHQLSLCPRVSLPETSPTLCWTGKVGNVSVFRFYLPTSRCVLSSQDVTFDESFPFYRLFPYRTAPLPHPPLFLAPGPPLVDPLPPQGPAPLGVSQVDPLPGTVPVEVAVDSGAARGAASRGAASGGVASGGDEPTSAVPGGAEHEGAESRGAELEGAGSGGTEPGGAEPGGTEPEGAEPGGAEFEGAESGGAEPWGTASVGGPVGALPRLSPRWDPLLPQQLREWFAQGTRLRSGAAGAGGSPAGGTRAGGPGATSPGGARTRGTGAARAGGVGDSGARDPGAGAIGAGGARAGGAGAGDPGAGGTGFGGAGARDPGAGGAGVTAGARGTKGAEAAGPGGAHNTGTRAAGAGGVGGTGAGDPGAGGTGAATFTARPPTRAASPTVPHLLATFVIDPSFESSATSALVAELVDFATACRLDYATSLVAESESDYPPSVGGECALGTDVLEDRQEDFECLAAAVPHLMAMLLAPEGDPDAPDIPTPRSYAEAIRGTYVDAVPRSGANIVDGMWIFWVKRPPGSPPVFKARYVARGFKQRQGVDFFQTFSPSPKMTTLRALLHVAAQRDYELHFLDFNTALL